jgi:hypothetical protein
MIEVEKNLKQTQIKNKQLNLTVNRSTVLINMNMNTNRTNKTINNITNTIIRKNAECQEEDFNTAFYGIRYYFHHKPELEVIKCFHYFVNSDLSKKFLMKINNLSEGNTSNFEISIVFDNLIYFNTKDEFEEFYRIINGFDKLNHSFSVEYRGYKCDIISDNLEDVNEVINKVIQDFSIISLSTKVTFNELYRFIELFKRN